MSQQLAQILLREDWGGKFEKGQIIGLVKKEKYLLGVFSTVDLFTHHLLPLGIVFFVVEQVDHSDIPILILSSGNPGTCKRVADDSW